MDAERFERVERLFQELRRLVPAERARRLDEACTDDLELRGEVESLLAVHDAPDAPLGEESGPPLDVRQAVADAWTGAPGHPEQIGPYRITDVVGRGGMGIVYLAQQERPRRRVAVKVIQPACATPEVLRRFEHEAQVLGHLRHAGIAQVYEAGIEGEVPYIAMEYVEGRPLSLYVQEEEPELRDLLVLYLHICDAVQHAHRKGVIHRDLKPGNILVEGRGEAARPKILDFGIARVTDADVRSTTLVTGVGKLLGTIQYMSPEQAAGGAEDLDTRSDVYSLGVILYEMLTTGDLPYDVSGRMLHEAVRIIREEEPASMHIGTRRLPADLVTIVGKALEKDRERRYSSAEQLAGDVRHFLDDEPIAARPPTAIYQLSKFARRNRVWFIGIASVFIALVLGLLTTAWQWRKSELVAAQLAESRDEESKQRELSERRFEDVRHLARTFLFDFDREITYLQGSLPARRLIVTSGLEYLDRLAQEEVPDQTTRRELAMAYSRVGDIQGAPDRPNLGDSVGALASYRKSLALIDDLVADGVDEHGLRADRMLVFLRIGDVVSGMGDPAAALEDFEQARVVAETLTEYEQWTVQSRIAGSLVALDRYEEAREILARTHAYELEQFERDPTDAEERRLAVSHFQLGGVAESLGELDSALEHYQESLKLVQEAAARTPRNAVSLRDVGTGHARLANVLLRLGRHEEARDHYDTGLALARERVATSPEDVQALLDLSGCYTGLGQLSLARKDYEEARRCFEQLLDIGESLLARNESNAAMQRRHAIGLYKMGELHRQMAQDGEFARESRRAFWSEGKDWFERSRGAFEAMAARGVQTVDDELKMTAAELSVCNLALQMMGAE